MDIQDTKYPPEIINFVYIVRGQLVGPEWNLTINIYIQRKGVTVHVSPTPQDGESP